MELIKYAEERKNCPMRHENGNCLMIGGFCLAVNDEVCRGLHNAYNKGVETKPIKYGKWIKTIGESGVTDAVCCSICGFEDNRYELFNYCPRCGAKMDRVEKSNEEG